MMNKPPAFALGCLLALAAPFATMAATTWYVTKSGKDTNSGKSESAAFLTIQKAVNSCAAKDVIIVGDGTYAPVSTGNKLLTIRSKNGHRKTIIDAQGLAACFDCGGNYDETNSCIIGFSLINGHAPGNYNLGGGAYGGTLKNCVISNCFAESKFGGVAFVYAENCVIAANWCHNNYSAVGHSTLRNCTIVGNYLVGSMAGAPASVRNSSLVNCIVWNNPAGGVSGTSSTSSCYMNNPSFVNEASGDYRLKDGSPCVDAGEGSYPSGAIDLAGNKRVYNGKVDIGAYEYQPPTGSVENITATSRYPWNGLVDLKFIIKGDSGVKFNTSFSTRDVVGGTNLTMKTLYKSDGTAANVAKEQLVPGTYNWVWDATADLGIGTVLDRVTITIDVK